MENQLYQNKEANDDDPDSRTFDIGKYNYFKPSFTVFIQSKINSALCLSQKEISSSYQNVKPVFFSTMRYILDSKYNEFMIQSDYRLYSKFTDFVCSWLGTFVVDTKNYKLQRAIDSDEGEGFNADDNRLWFYL